jgi:hypothetical protein
LPATPGQRRFTDISLVAIDCDWSTREEAVKGTLAIFPAGISHIHRGRASHEHTKTIATGWINAGRREDDLGPLASSPAPASPAR